MPSKERGYCGACRFFRRLKRGEYSNDPDDPARTWFAPENNDGLEMGQCVFYISTRQSDFIVGPLTFSVIGQTGLENPDEVPLKIMFGESSLCNILLIGGEWAYEFPDMPDLSTPLT